MILGLDGGQAINNAGEYDRPHMCYRNLSLIQQASASFVRVNFRLGNYYKDWTTAGADGSFALDKYDQVIKKARDQGLSVLALACCETWNAAQIFWQENHVGNGNNPYMDNIVKSVKLIDKHYGDAIRWWEGWNEPNVWTHSVGSGGSYIYPSNFAALLTNMRSVLTKPLVSGGITSFDWGSGADYLDQTYQAGHTNQKWNKWPVDYIGQHFYVQQGGVVSAQTLLKNLFQVGVPVFVTEVGWQTNALTQQVQAENLATTVTTLVREHVAALSWFCAQDNPDANLYYGLQTSGTPSDNYTGVPKAAFTTYQVLAEGGGMGYPSGYEGNIKKSLDQWWGAILQTLPMDKEYGRLHVEWVTHILSKGRNPGPPMTELLPTVDWNGNPLHTVWFSNFRAEVTPTKIRWWDASGKEVTL